ncbi:hypothetical protein [Micromonospora marina]|uniref:hypothetical protein n=1 Tax=Micromonospora marina TaxID=307120 RepID=UPI003D70A134
MAGDEAYGSDPRLAALLGIGPRRMHHLAAGLPRAAWQRVSAGAGAKGHRYYDRAWMPLSAHVDAHAGHHWLLIRSSPVHR